MSHLRHRLHSHRSTLAYPRLNGRPVLLLHRCLDSLFDLFATPAGHRCDLQGAINGQWVIRTEDLSRCHIRLAVPSETAVRVGRAFEKPAGRPASLEIGWAIDPDCGEVESFNADLTVGPGRLSLDDGRAAFPAGADSQPKTAPMRLTGRFNVEKIEAILASLPFLKPFETCFGGTSDGRFAGEFDGGV